MIAKYKKVYENMDENSKIVLKNGTSSLLIKGSSLIIAIFTTPAYMRYFDNNAVLGVWFTALSVLAWVFYFDFGIGNGLRNILAKLITSGEHKSAKSYVSSAYIFLGILTFIIGAIFLTFVWIINWNSFFNIDASELSKNTLKIAMLITVTGILIQFILRLINSILLAAQKSFIPNLLSMITSTSLLFFVVICNHLDKNNNIISLALFYILAVNIPLIIISFTTFSFSLKKYRPSFKCFNFQHAKETLKLGGSFLYLQIAGIIVGHTSVTFLITRLISPETVVSFNVYDKIYNQVYVIFLLILFPVWSATTKAYTEKKYSWIKKTLNIYTLLALALFLFQFLLLPFMQYIFNIWLGDVSIIAETNTQLINIMYNGVLLFYSLTATFCNGIGQIKKQVLWMSIGAALVIPLSLFAIKINSHFTSILIAKALALLPYVIIQFIWLNRFLRKKILDENINDKNLI